MGKIGRKLQCSSELVGWHNLACGLIIPLGVLSVDMVTDNGAAYIVDALQNLTEMENLNWHDAGTGVNAEAQADAALQTPWGGARVAGAQTEPAANQYRTTATIAFTGPFAIVEHGLFSAAAAGTLFDRSKFGAVNVVNLESITFQYTLTVAAGG